MAGAEELLAAAATCSSFDIEVAASCCGVTACCGVVSAGGDSSDASSPVGVDADITYCEAPSLFGVDAAMACCEARLGAEGRERTRSDIGNLVKELRV